MAPKVALPSIYRLLFDFLTGVTGKKQQRGALNLQKSNSRWEKSDLTETYVSSSTNSVQLRLEEDLSRHCAAAEV